MGTFAQQRQGRTEEKSRLFPGRYGIVLNTKCYNCRKLGNLDHNYFEAGRAGTFSLQVIHSFSQ